MDKRRQTDFAAANLLVSADFLQPHQLDKAYAACRDRGTPLSHVLLDNRMVEPRHLSAAFEVVVEVSACRLSMATARTVLYLMGQCGLPIKEAMAKLGVVAASPNPWQAQLDALADVRV